MLIIAGFVILGEKSAVMVLLLDLETASELFLDELLGLFRCPPGSGRALLAGTLPLRYCAARFGCTTPTWRLPVSGHVVDLVTDAGAGQEVHWVSGSGRRRKRIRLNRKTPAHFAGLMVHSQPRVWKRLRHVVFSNFSILITRGGVVTRMMWVMF